MSGRPFIRAALMTRSTACSDADFPHSAWVHEECPGFAPVGEPCACHCHPDDSEEPS